MMQHAQNCSKYLTFLATLASAFCVTTIICKFKVEGSGYQLLYSLFCVINFMLLDIITEVYGFNVVIKFYWSLIIAKFVFLLIYAGVVELPSSTSAAVDYRYHYLLDQIWAVILINPFLCLIAWYANAKLFVKFRIILSGKYFWLRSTGASGLAEALFIILISFAYTIFHVNKYKPDHILPVMIVIIQRIFLTAFLAYPSQFIVNILKVLENRQKKMNLNPLKEVYYR